MHPQRFALIGGIVLLVMGVLSLIPAMRGTTEGLPPLDLETSYGLFLGLFPVNIINKIAWIALGAMGIYASRAKFRDLPASINWSRMVFFISAALAIMGLIPATNTFFGYMPLFGGEVWMHAVMAIAGAYFGYALTSRVPDSGPARKDFTSPLHGTR